MAENNSSLAAKPDATNPGTPDGPKTADLGPSPLSKSARKKAAKAERYAAYKLERRAREKEARKEKKRVRAEMRAAGDLDDELHEGYAPEKKRLKLEFGGRVVIDLGFDDMMSDKVGGPNRSWPTRPYPQAPCFRKSRRFALSWLMHTAQTARHLTLFLFSIHLSTVALWNA
jgi:hypothetical protein